MYKIILSLLLFLTPLHSNEEMALLPDIFIKRHSGTHFLPDAISEIQMKALAQSARWSPSSYNDQPWNFIFCNIHTTPEAYNKALDCIYGQEWVDNAPLLVIAVVRSHFLHNGGKNIWAEYDTGAAALSMALLATDLGLMAHQIGGFDSDQLKEDFQIPDGFFPLAIIAIGYEDESQPLDEERLRRPLEDNFFEGAWGKGI